MHQSKPLRFFDKGHGMRFREEVAIVTGAGRGIGEAISVVSAST
jgi:hypothetical protein